MKIKKTFVLITTVLLFASLSIANNPLKIEPIQRKDSRVKIVNNPGTPLYGKIKLEIEEDLSIGNDEDENCLFNRRISFDIDKEGNFYILDSGSYRVLKFNKAGQFLNKFGRKGEGPGEFQYPFIIFLDLNENIYVNNYSNTLIFNNDGTFKKNIDVPFEKLMVTTEGHYLGKFSSSHGPKRTEKIILSTKEGEIIKTIAEKEINSIFIKIGPFPRVFDIFIKFYSLNGQSGVFFFSNECKLRIINNSGNIIHIIKTEHPSEPFTRKEKKKIKNEGGSKYKKAFDFSDNDLDKMFNFPKNKPAYFKVLVDDQDRVYAEKWNLKRIFTRNKPKETIYYLFSKEGRFLYEIISPIYFDIIRNGYIYKSTTVPDKDIAQVKRYKIKNWDKIKGK